MSNQNTHPRVLSLLLLLTVILMAVPQAAHAEFQKELTLRGDELTLSNLIGRVQLVGGEGDQFKIHVDVRGKDASEDLIQLKSEEQGGKVRVLVQFPTDKERDYVYPALGAHSHSSFRSSLGSGESRSWFAKVFGSSEKVEVRGSGKGLEVWADLRIEVPRGKGTKLYLGCGTIEAQDLTADLSLDVHSGPVTAARIKGSLLIDTGSGHVSVSEAEGEVNIDTGSGQVNVRGLRGNLYADTGSGSVLCRNVLCENLLVDTGSGGIELVLAPETSARIEADTGSGGVDIDYKGATIEKHSKDHALLTVGAGKGRYSLDTGSGTIRIH
jgi:hypothetical protein